MRQNDTWLKFGVVASLLLLSVTAFGVVNMAIRLNRMTTVEQDVAELKVQMLAQKIWSTQLMLELHPEKAKELTAILNALLAQQKAQERK